MFFTAAVFAASTSAPGDFSGKWRIDASKSQGHDDEATWMIDQKHDSVHIQAFSANSKPIANFECDTLGKECSFKEDGRPAKVSAWFNGAALVLLETHGHHGDTVIKKKLELSADGKQFRMQVDHIVPPGDDETIVYDKIQ